MLRKVKGQSTLEYAMIIAVIVGGLIAMQYYMKRGIQGKLRESTDSIGEQYSAGNMTSKFTTEQVGTQTSKETFGMNSDGSSTGDTAAATGASRYEITGAAEKTSRIATGDDAEKITKTLAGESLFGEE